MTRHQRDQLRKAGYAVGIGGSLRTRKEPFPFVPRTAKEWAFLVLGLIFFFTLFVLYTAGGR